MDVLWARTILTLLAEAQHHVHLNREKNGTTSYEQMNLHEMKIHPIFKMHVIDFIVIDSFV